MSDTDKGALNSDLDREGIESSETHYKTSFTAIRKARRFALQGLYSWSLTDLPINEIEAKTRSDNAMHTVHLGYYHELLTQITTQVEQIDALIESAIDRPIAMITKIELAVLRIGVFELKYRLEIPFKVVIDEAIQLNEHFGSDQGYRFINAVMDKLASTLRTLEVTELESQGARKPKKPYTPKPPRVKKSLERGGLSSSKTDDSAKAEPASTGARLGRKRAEAAPIEQIVQNSDVAAESVASDMPADLSTQDTAPKDSISGSTSSTSNLTAISAASDQPNTEDQPSTDQPNPDPDATESANSELAASAPSEDKVEASPATAVKDKPDAAPAKAKAKSTTKAAAKPKAVAKPKAAAKPKTAAKPKSPAKTADKPAAKPRSIATAKPKLDAD